MTGKGRKNTDGFTLIELIVVIAVLTILAGILLASYLGYTKKSKDTADEVTVSQVAKALELQYYAQGLDGSASVRLSPNGLKLTGTGDDFVTQAMQNTFGDTWPGISLRPQSSSTDTATHSHAEELLNCIQNSAQFVWNMFPVEGGTLPSDVELVFRAAKASTLEITQESFSMQWCKKALWGTPIKAEGEMLQVDAQIANFAATQARNRYVAQYLLEKKLITTEKYNILCNLTAPDFAGCICLEKNKNAYIASILGADADAAIAQAVEDYFDKQASQDAGEYYNLLCTIYTENPSSWDALVAVAAKSGDQEQQPEYGDGSVIITIVGDDQGYHIDIQRG